MKTISHEVCEKRIKADVFYLDLIRDFISVGGTEIIKRGRKRGKRRKMKKEIILDNEKSRIPSLPCTPFLLTSVMKKGNKRQFVIEGFEGETIEENEGNHFVQSFKWRGHIANEEEVKEYLGEDE